RASTYMRGVVAIYLVATLCTSFAIPELLREVRGSAPLWTWFMPSCWFVGLCQTLRGRATPVMLELSRAALPASAVFALLALALYAISYRRHFVRIGEMSDGGARGKSRSARPSLW